MADTRPGLKHTGPDVCAEPVRRVASGANRSRATFASATAKGIGARKRFRRERRRRDDGSPDNSPGTAGNEHTGTFLNIRARYGEPARVPA